MSPKTKSLKRRANERMAEAVNAVGNGYTYRDASLKFRVPLGTLHRKVNKTERKAGRRKALTNDEEQLIVNFLIRYSDRGIPLTKAHLREAVEIVVGRMDLVRRLRLPFNRCRPGRAFLRSFIKRHSDRLAFGNPLRQENNRFRAVSCDILTTHFAVLDKVIDENGLDPSRIFNLDESGSTPDRDLSGQTAAKRFMTRNGGRDFCMAEFKNLNRITMMPVISASGNAGPPLFVFKGSRMPYRWSKRGGVVTEETPVCRLPYGSTAALRLENGRVDSVNFRNWAFSFVSYVRPTTTNNKKVLLIYDGYRAHLSLDVLEIFHHNNIIVYALPAHTSGKTQPLDVVVFSVCKSAMNTVLNNYTATEGERKQLNVFDFCYLLKEAYDTSFTPQNIRAAFRRSGIWPLDVGKILEVPRPATNEQCSHVLTVEDMAKEFERKRVDYRTRVLGDDATITSSGYFDTTHGCVMTAERVLNIVRSKQVADCRKIELQQQKQSEREARERKRRMGHLLESKKWRRSRIVLCEQLSGQTYEEFIVKERPMKERRMATKARFANEGRA